MTIKRDDWFDSARYYPPYHGGFVLVQHYPEKKGKEEFGRFVLLSEDAAKCVVAAYEFRRRNAALFGKQFKEEQLLKLLDDENPVIAIMAAQRLAQSKSDRLAGKALAAALDGPADLRLAVATYLVFVPRGEFVPDDGKSEGEVRVPSEVASAINKADAKRLRFYAMGISASASRSGLTDGAVAAMKLCRERAGKLRVDERLREELNDLFDDADLPPLE